MVKRTKIESMQKTNEKCEHTRKSQRVCLYLYLRFCLACMAYGFDNMKRAGIIVDLLF
jgi:hypothetical protein